MPSNRDIVALDELMTSQIRPALIWLFCLIGLISVVYQRFTAMDYYGSQEHLFLSLNGFLSVLPDNVWLNITQLGDAKVLFPIVALVIFRMSLSWFAMLYAVPFASVLSEVGKHIANVPRPAAVIDPTLFNIVGGTLSGHNSLPSGHTITVFTGIFVVIFTLLQKPENSKDWLVLVLCCAVAVAGGLSRVAVGAHWPGDVLIGAICGLLAATIGTYFAKRTSTFHIQRVKSHCSPWFFCCVMLIWSQFLFKAAMETEIGSLIVWVSACCASLVAFRLMGFSLAATRLRRHAS